MGGIITHYSQASNVLFGHSTCPFLRSEPIHEITIDHHNPAQHLLPAVSGTAAAASTVEGSWFKEASLSWPGTTVVASWDLIIAHFNGNMCVCMHYVYVSAIILGCSPHLGSRLWPQSYVNKPYLPFFVTQAYLGYNYDPLTSYGELNSQYIM